jgi:hypothetical protein
MFKKLDFNQCINPYISNFKGVLLNLIAKIYQLYQYQPFYKISFECYYHN